jgi:hypothetical protein
MKMGMGMRSIALPWENAIFEPSPDGSLRVRNSTRLGPYPGGSFAEPTQLDYDTWMTTNHSICGRYNPVGVDPCAFVGWIRPRVAGNGTCAPVPVKVRHRLTTSNLRRSRLVRKIDRSTFAKYICKRGRDVNHTDSNH